MDIINTIALLCQIQIGAMGISIEKLDSFQLECQKYYIKCTEASFGTEEARLKNCILKREAKF